MKREIRVSRVKKKQGMNETKCLPEKNQTDLSGKLF